MLSSIFWLTTFSFCRGTKTMNNAIGNQNNNVQPNGEMPEYARQMFESFMKAYAQVQEQISAIYHHQSENGEGHSNNRDGSGEGSNNGNRNRERDTLYKRFNEFRPKSFEETTNPWDANKWAEHMEGIFEVMGCTEHQKAILAAFKLEGDAKEWWKAAKRSFNGQETEITWAYFKREFIKKFIPDHIRAQKKREFETLVQGNLTIAKYACHILLKL